MGRYFKYFLLLSFLVAILVIVFLQFNSNRSINQLINGNEKLLGEQALENNLGQLQTDIITLESKVRGTVIQAEAIDSDHIQHEITDIENSLQELQKLRSDSAISPLIDHLGTLVHAKIDFNREVIDTFSWNGKTAAEALINHSYGKVLTDSIKNIATQTDSLHKLTVTALIKKADNDGRRARTLGTIMALIAAFASIFTFGYVAFKVREQQQLITRLNESEKKVREAARIKENFLANMSHEIRTPLNAILGFTNLLQQNQQGDDSGEYIQTIKRSGENLLAIINDILDLSKIEAGMMRIESAPFSIRGLVHSIETMFKTKAVEKQISLLTLIDQQLPDTLEGDGIRLTQILINLVGNSIKFTEKGKIVVTISQEERKDNIVTLGIEVTDTGIGIEKDKLKDVFERFRQAEDAVTRKYGGTGLGLAIVKDLIELQKGKIDIQSEPGKGTSFKLLIPYKVVEETADVPAKSAAAFPADLAKANVLVVEDNEINQSLLRHLFNKWKISFDIAGNGKEAISILQRKSYHLILMDIQMPMMDGYTTTQQIRTHLKLNTPIIAMTAHALAGEREKCISYGMNEYIAKPFKEEVLYRVIEQFTVARLSAIPVNTSPGITNHYNFIDLGYMKEVSSGNTEYERTVTSQFIEAVPEELLSIEKAWKQNDHTTLRQLAHNMKSTISVMGLNEPLKPYLDALEFDVLNEDSFQQHFSALSSICTKALEEARSFYESIVNRES